MPKQLDQGQFEQIAALLAPHSAGLAITELEAACKAEGLSFDRRTLQRRLQELIKTKRVIREGNGRASHYQLAPITGDAHVALAPAQLVARGETYVPTSPQGAEIRNLVRRPITDRRPTGYNRDFLESYQPNISAYLSDSVRDHLHALGRLPARERDAGTYARDILNRLLIDLSWSSSRLEGNTYSRLDTQNLIEFGHTADGKEQRETQMILNHKAAIELLVSNADEVGFDAFTFLNLHALLSENLLADADASGRLRMTTVEIGGSVYLPLAAPQQIEHCFRLILDKANAVRDPFEQAFFVMVQIPYLQPFLDVNKRVSRLGANIPLIKHYLSPLSFIDVPEKAYVDGTLGVYELNRVDLLQDVFVWAYERSCQRYVAIKDSLVEPDPLRMRYRQALIDVVGRIVRDEASIDARLIRELATPLVPREDLDQFVAMAFNDLHHLHEGSVARYRLRLGEFQKWKKSYS